MFPLTNWKGSPRKVQRKQRPRLQPRLEGLEGRALLSQAGDLLINGDFSLGNTGFTTQYTDWAIDHYNAGWYGICHNPSIDFDPLFANFGDHTTGTGLMFGANGAMTPNVVAWQETVNVPGNTDYVLSGWASSMGQWPPGTLTDPSPARLRFSSTACQSGRTSRPPLRTANGRSSRRLGTPGRAVPPRFKSLIRISSQSGTISPWTTSPSPRGSATASPTAPGRSSAAPPPTPSS